MHELLVSVRRLFLVPLTSVVIEPPEHEVLHSDGLVFLNFLTITFKVEISHSNLDSVCYPESDHQLMLVHICRTQG